MTKDQFGRKDRLIQERRHDVYFRRTKLASPACCPQCGLMFINGRWLWQEATPPDEADRVLCPACHRIADHYPAGYVEIRGPFFQSHRRQIINLIRNTADRENSDRPLERIMAIKGEQDHLLVTTTGIHVARRIGQALESAYKGGLVIQYADSGHSIRVSWQR